MAAILAKYGVLTVLGEITADSCSVGALEIGSGPVIVSVSDDAAMLADSDSVLPTSRAFAEYADNHDSGVLAAAQQYVDARTNNQYSEITIFNGTDTGELVTLRGADSGTLTVMNESGNIGLYTDEPGDFSAGIASITSHSAVNTLVLDVSGGGVRNAANNNRWLTASLDPYVIAGVAGPTMSQDFDWGTYSFPHSAISTYFATISIPFVADRDDPPTELRLYMRYTMSGTSVSPVIFRTTYQLASRGDIIGSAETNDTEVIPAGAANTVYAARLIMPATTVREIGAQLLLSFARIPSANTDTMRVWDISLAYNHAIWGRRDEL